MAARCGAAGCDGRQRSRHADPHAPARTAASRSDQAHIKECVRREIGIRIWEEVGIALVAVYPPPAPLLIG